MENTRYAVTHVIQKGTMKGFRTLSFANQGRNLFDTPEQAQSWIESARKANSASTMAMYGIPDTLEVRPVECYVMRDGSLGDAKAIYFDDPGGGLRCQQ